MNIRKLLYTLLTLVATGLMWSCSDTDTRDYRDYVSNDYLMVQSVNALNLLENAGFSFNSSGIVAPESMREFVSRNWDKMQDILKVEGVDPRQIVIAIDSIDTGNGNDNATAYIKLSNPEKFAKYIEQKLNFKKIRTEGSVDIYGNGSMSCGIDGKLAIVSGKSLDLLADNLPKMQAKAKSNPLSDWKVRALDNDVTSVTILDRDQMMVYLKTLPTILAQISDNESLKNTSMLIEAELKDLSLKATFKTVDSTGNTLTPPVEFGKFDKSLLAYTSPIDRIVGISALPDDPSWKAAFTEMLRSALGTVDDCVEGIYKDIEGSVMFAMGYNSLLSFSTGRGLHCAIAVQCAPGTIDNVYKAWYDALKLGTPPYTITDDGTVITIKYGNISYYITKHGNTLVGSTDLDLTTTGEAIIPTSDFGDYNTQMILKVPNADASITAISLPFSLDIDLYSDASVGVFTIEMGNTDGKFIENIINFIAKL